MSHVRYGCKLMFFLTETLSLLFFLSFKNSSGCFFLIISVFIIFIHKETIFIDRKCNLSTKEPNKIKPLILFLVLLNQGQH